MHDWVGIMLLIRIGDNIRSVMDKVIFEVLTGLVGRGVQKIVRNLNLALGKEVRVRELFWSVGAVGVDEEA